MNIDDEGYRQADKSEGDEYAFRLVIPMAVAPRYTPIHSDPTRGSYDMGQAIQLRGLLSIEGDMLCEISKFYKCAFTSFWFWMHLTSIVLDIFLLRLGYHVVSSFKHL